MNIHIKATKSVTRAKQVLFFTLIGLILASVIANQEQVTNFSHKPVIIWDLGGVALQTNRKKAVPVIGATVGATRWLAYNLLGHGFHPAEAQKAAFEFMDWRRGNPPHTAAKNGDIPLPLDMREVLKGITSPSEVAESICKDCDKHANYFVENYKSNNSAREMVKGVIRCLLPENLVKIQEVNPKTLELVRACKQANNCELLILSNWDKESCAQLIASKPELFENFEPNKIIFSGNTGFMKPEPEIYNYVTSKYNLDPADCILIDDQPENIAAARAAGWQNSFVHIDAETTKAKLTRLGVLRAPENSENYNSNSP